MGRGEDGQEPGRGAPASALVSHSGPDSGSGPWGGGASGTRVLEAASRRLVWPAPLGRGGFLGPLSLDLGNPISEFWFCSKAWGRILSPTPPPNSSSCSGSLRFLICQSGAGVLASQGMDQVESHRVPRLWCPERNLARGGGRGEGTPELACHARQRALRLTRTVLIFNATRSSVSLSPLFTDGETSREKSGPCLRSRAPQRLRPSLLPLAPFADSRGPSPCRCHDNGGPIGNKQRRPRPCPAPGGGLRTIRAPGRAAGAGSQERQAPTECSVHCA